MPLTVDEIKTIGQKTGKKVVVHEKCKERADFVLELMTDLRDTQVEIMSAIVDPKARRSVISRISSEIDSIREVYPESPTTLLIIDELTAIKKKAEQNTSGGTMAFVEQTAQGYVGLHDKMRDVLLEDFQQCSCEGGIGATMLQKLNRTAHLDYGLDYADLSPSQQAAVRSANPVV